MSHEVNLKLHDYKPNQVTCSCGLMQYFDRGRDATYNAELHARNNPESSVVATLNGEELKDCTYVALPKRADGSSFLHNRTGD